MPTKKEIEDLGAPWLAMGSLMAQDDYRVSPTTSHGLTPNIPTHDSSDDSPLSLEGGGVGSIDSRKRRPEYDWQARLRYGKSF